MAALFAGTTFAISGGVTALRQGTPVTEDETIILSEFQNSVDRLKAATGRLRAVRVPDRARRWLVGTPTIRIDLGDHVEAGEHLGFRVIALHGVTGKASASPFQPTVTTSDSDLCEVHEGAYGTNPIASQFTLEAKAPGACTVFASLHIAGDLIVEADPVALSITTPAPPEETLAPEVALTRSDGSQVSTSNSAGSPDSPTSSDTATAAKELSIASGIFTVPGCCSLSSGVVTMDRGAIDIAYRASEPVKLDFASNTPEVCSITGTEQEQTLNKAHLQLHTPGDCTITATYPGDGTYGPATKSKTVTVTS